MMKRKKAKKAGIHIILCLLSLVFIFPFFWLIRSSVMSSAEIFAVPMRWIPSTIHWENYQEALTAFPFVLYLKNTLIIVLLNIAGNVLSSSFAGFGFARMAFPGKNFLFGLVISTMMIPSSVLQIPQFIIWQMIGCYDTYAPLTIPSFFLNAFYIFLMRQFIMTIPRNYDEAALIDGAGYLSIYSRIVLPLTKPAVATVCVFSFMGAWNDFVGPLIYLRSSEKYTLSLGLQSFLDRYVNQWHYLMAASTVVILPMLILYFFAQRYFIEGITFSGIKG